MGVRGSGKVVSGSTEFCTFSSCLEPVIPCSNRISWNTTSEFINLSFKLLIGFLSSSTNINPQLWCSFKFVFKMSQAMMMGDSSITTHH